MPMHDWTRVPVDIFHALHHHWVSAITDALNAKRLPNTFYALPEHRTSLKCDLITRAYIETVGVGDALPDMALFLEPGGCVQVPLEATYQTAFTDLPKRWRDVLEAK